MNSRVPPFEVRLVSIGVDVHREFFVSSCVSGGTLLRRSRLPFSSKALISF